MSSSAPSPPSPRRMQSVAARSSAVAGVLLAITGAALVYGPREAASLPALTAHLALGLLLCVALPAFVFPHFSTHRRHPNARARSVGLVLAVLSLAGCLAGLAAWGFAVRRDTRWWVTAHELSFGLTAFVYLAHRLAALSARARKGELLAAFGVGATTLLIVALPRGAPAEAENTRPTQLANRHSFEPGLSPARTQDGHELTIEQLHDGGDCATCHPAIAERWESSAHRFSSLNDPFYAATLALAQKTRQPEELTFCGGCHDPALLFSGAMREHPTPSTPGADLGISCLSCHAIESGTDLRGNASYVVTATPTRPSFDLSSEASTDSSLRNIRRDPSAHRSQLRPEGLDDSAFCVSCHKASLTPELTGHRWIRGQNEFDPWFDSGAGGQSARTFYSPGEPKRCQDCHMPRIEAEDPAARDGLVADHAFPGSNTALASVRGDDAAVQRSEHMLEGVVSIDIGAYERGGDRLFVPTGTLAALPGDEVTLDFVVRNREAGHLFPGGIADLREVWLEVAVLDAEGKALLGSGWVGDDDQVDPQAHRWNTVLLDGEGRHLRRHQVEQAHVVLDSRRIMLGASDLARVQFVLPKDAVRVRARVFHRKFPRDFVQFALGEAAPAMPTTVLSAIELPMGKLQLGEEKDDGPRLRDLGIAYLLSGDTERALEASSMAAEAMPKDPGPHLDLARIALADGDLESAEASLRRADAISPGHPTGAWLLARVRAAQGDHQEALVALDRALESFPKDRELLRMKGESLFRLERFEDARVPLQAALAIDPEMLGAHALLAQVEAELGNEKARAQHQAMWDRLRPRSSDQAITRSARQRNPILDRRANRPFVVPLLPPPEAARFFSP